jgi:hypothetical protein
LASRDAVLAALDCFAQKEQALAALVFVARLQNRTADCIVCGQPDCDCFQSRNIHHKNLLTELIGGLTNDISASLNFS